MAVVDDGVAGLEPFIALCLGGDGGLVEE